MALVVLSKMVRQNITLGEDAQNLLDTLVEVFNSTRSNIVEELIIDYVDDYANSRKDELDAWIEEHGEESDEDEDEDLDEEPEEFEE